MSKARAFMLGIFLCLVGLVKIFAHAGDASPADPFAASWCRSADFVAPQEGLMLTAHCWGCFAVFAGMALLAGAAYFKARAARKTEACDFKQTKIGALI